MLYSSSAGKYKVHFTTEHEGPEKVNRYSSTMSLTWAPDGWVINATPPSFYPRKIDSVPIVYEYGWAPEPVWMDVENFDLTGIRSPIRPARTWLVFRVRY